MSFEEKPSVMDCTRFDAAALPAEAAELLGQVQLVVAYCQLRVRRQHIVRVRRLTTDKNKHAGRSAFAKSSRELEA